MALDIRESFLVQDRRMLLMSFLIVAVLAGNLYLIWTVLGGDVLHRGVLPVTGVLIVLWFLVWAGNLMFLQEKLHYYKDTIVALSGMVASTMFLLMAVATDSYGDEERLCLLEDTCIGWDECYVEDACIEHAFTVPEGFAAVILTGVLFVAGMQVLPRIFFPHSYGPILGTPFLAAWGDRTEEEDADLGGMQPLQKTGLHDVQLDHLVLFQRISRYHVFVLPVIAFLTVANAVLWDRIPGDLHGPYYLEWWIMGVVGLHLVFLLSPRSFDIYAGNIMVRLKNVSYGLSVLDGIIIGVLAGIMLLYEGVPLTGQITGPTSRFMLVTTVTLPFAVILPMIFHFGFFRRGQRQQRKQAEQHQQQQQRRQQLEQRRRRAQQQ